MPKIKKSKRIAERRAGLQESHQEAHVNEQHPKEHPVSSNRDGVLDKSPGQTPEVAVLSSEAEFHVWVVGSSIVKRAFVAARNRTGGVCLGLQRLGINIWWQGKGGMVWLDMYKKIKTLLKVNDKPQYLILHCGANDVGSTPLKSLIQNIKTSLGKIQLLLPNTKIIWSQLLPRRQWRYSVDVKAMNKSLKRLNSSIAAEVVKMGEVTLSIKI
ncbi:uncharacterized protein LOC111107615 [Crassostrea virginica]